jgi:predicted dehydrogenase
MAMQIAIVGMGARGRDWVREVRNNEFSEVVACVDNDSTLLESSAKAAGISPQQCFTDLEAALSTDLVDAVIVATSPESHFSVCETALSREKAVLVEKPFTLKLKQAVDLVSLADRQQTPLLVAQNYRYLRSFRTARQLIAAGTLGRVGLVLLQYYRVPHEMADSLARLPQSVLWGMGIHHLDALRFVLQKRITHVLSEFFNLPWAKSPAGASMQVLLELEDGIRGSYLATYESSGHEYFERGQEFYARFVGEQGTLHVFQRWLILCERGKLPRLIRRGPRRITEEQALLNELQKALNTGDQSELSGQDNLQTMAVVEACVRSATEERWINPQELLDELE